jgi:hypothetical protein
MNINVSQMFAKVEPCFVSGSQSELGQSAGQLTWRNATEIALNNQWLLSSKEEAVEEMREWALSTGAWDLEEVDSWSDEECLALLAQNIASDLRMLGSDENELTELAEIYQETDWDSRPEYPTGSYYLSPEGDLLCWTVRGQTLFTYTSMTCPHPTRR